MRGVLRNAVRYTVKRARALQCVPGEYRVNNGKDVGFDLATAHTRMLCSDENVCHA